MTKKKPTPKAERTPRPEPVAWRFEQALAKMRRGFVMQDDATEVPAQMRIRRGRLECRFYSHAPSPASAQH